MDGARARVVLLCGPSGSGKSHVAARCGLPVVRLDDFYRDIDDPALPRSDALGVVDWDDPASWKADDALAALERLCRDGRAEVPLYDMARSVASGTVDVELGQSATVVAEGVFAPLLVAELRSRGLLADAVVLHRAPWQNFHRRLRRDIAEKRGPLPVLWKRGRLLMAAEPGIVSAAEEQGCRRVRLDELEALLAELRAGPDGHGTAH